MFVYRQCGVIVALEISDATGPNKNLNLNLWPRVGGSELGGDGEGKEWDSGRNLR